MKLSKIYSNNSRRFQPIVFNEGLSILYAKVTRPKSSDKDSHNLGKTLLIKLIDFMLLADLKQGHFLYDNKETFKSFEFFLELQLNRGGFVTVRRDVTKSSKVSIKLHQERGLDLSMTDDSFWDFDRISLSKAVATLNEILGLTAISPWTYRKGITYCLRTQADYLDVFQTSRFAVGKHMYWKPYVATVLGFPTNLVEEKYKIDEEIADKEKFRKEYTKEAGLDLTEYDRLKGLIQIKRDEIEANRIKINRFDFAGKELSINADLVGKIESRISELNELLYDTGLELERIRESLSKKVRFDLDQVKRLFEEASVFFPDQLVRSYQDLQTFNAKLYEDRNKRLEGRMVVLGGRKLEMEKELTSLNGQRESFLEILQNKDTFAKFRLLQVEVIQQEAKLAHLEAELVNLDLVSKISKEVRELVNRRQDVVAQIEVAVNNGNSTYSSIRHRFNEIIRNVLGNPALLSTKVNSEGNLEFNAQLIRDEESLSATSEGQGTSYKKMLCATFDMAVLETYATQSFYRFVYHDGILEGFDNRVKVRFMEAINKYCGEFGLQYILTVIDADIPRDLNDSRIQFPNGTVVREFHEASDEGRLFNMPKF